MHLNGLEILGAAVVGLLVGLTGSGGGALMTPMLILLFGVPPSAAISSDLVASVFMRPVGALVHARAGTISWRLVVWLAAGSVPAAVLGSFILHELGPGRSAEAGIRTILGIALLIGAVAMTVRVGLDRLSGEDRNARIAQLEPKRALTLLVGVAGGVVVGLTSVGSGSLMVVALLFIYPRLSANQLVGTDLTQAVPLTLAAALGSLIWGHVEFAVTVSLILGAVPAVAVGSLLSSRVPSRYVRPGIVVVIFISGLKYAGLGAGDLGWAALSTLAVGLAGWLTLTRMTSGARARVRPGPGRPVGRRGQLKA